MFEQDPWDWRGRVEVHGRLEEIPDDHVDTLLGADALDSGPHRGRCLAGVFSRSAGAELLQKAPLTAGLSPRLAPRPLHAGVGELRRQSSLVRVVSPAGTVVDEWYEVVTRGEDAHRVVGADLPAEDDGQEVPVAHPEDAQRPAIRAFVHVFQPHASPTASLARRSPPGPLSRLRTSRARGRAFRGVNVYRGLARCSSGCPSAR